MKIKTFLIVFITITLIIPNIVFAVWWNPFTWFKKTTPTTQSISPKIQPTVEELSKKIEVLQKQIDENNSIQSRKAEPTVIQKTQKVSPVYIPTQSDSMLKVAKCQAEKQEAYNTALQTFDRTVNLAELNRQMNIRIEEISKEEIEKKAQCENIVNSDPYAKLACTTSASTDKLNRITAEVWKFNDTKRNSETARLKLVENIIFDRIYTTCLNN